MRTNRNSITNKYIKTSLDFRYTTAGIKPHSSLDARSHTQNSETPKQNIEIHRGCTIVCHTKHVSTVKTQKECGNILILRSTNHLTTLATH